jgi:lysophospholipase L1-like esterase
MKKRMVLMTLRRSIKIILVNFCLLIILSLLAEGILQFYPVNDPFEQDKISIRQYFNPVKLPNKNFSFIIEDSLPGFEEYIKYPQLTSNNLGFRNSQDMPTRDKENNEFRVFAIGGSTTECAFLNDGDDWPSLLGDQLNTIGLEKTFKVINAGQSGHSLTDNLHLIIQKLIHLKPDLFIVYTGVNDLYGPMSNSDLYKLDLTNAPRSKGLNLFLTDTQLGRRFYYLLKGYMPNAYHVTAKTRQRILAREFQKMPISNFPKELDFSLSRHNLKALIGICQSLGIKLLVATQAVSWDVESDDLNAWQNALYGGKRYGEGDLRKAMDLLNMEFEKICIELNTPVLNSQKKLVATAENFYDDMHFNPRGSRNMSDLIFKYLIEDPQLIGGRIP